jgi:RNA polymerase sigma-70 factor (ECF subfamily)
MADDAEHLLVLELQRREPGAWGRTYDSHATDVFTFIAHLLHGDRAVAEEIHQETWLAALTGIDAFEAGRGELRAWIFGIARRRVALHYRRRGATALKDAGNQVAAAATAMEEGSILPDDVVDSIERADAVRAALAELGTDTRSVLLGKYVDGKTVNDLARQLGRSPKAIESLLSRARARMRSLLRRYFDKEEKVRDVTQ